VEEGGNQIATKCSGTSVNYHAIWGEYRNRFVNSCPPLLMVIASFLPSSYPLVLSQRISTRSTLAARRPMPRSSLNGSQ
jgi:hypothetical protein